MTKHPVNSDAAFNCAKRDLSSYLDNPSESPFARWGLYFTWYPHGYDGDVEIAVNGFDDRDPWTYFIVVPARDWEFDQQRGRAALSYSTAEIQWFLDNADKLHEARKLCQSH